MYSLFSFLYCWIQHCKLTRGLNLFFTPYELVLFCRLFFWMSQTLTRFSWVVARILLSQCTIRYLLWETLCEGIQRGMGTFFLNCYYHILWTWNMKRWSWSLNEFPYPSLYIFRLFIFIIIHSNIYTHTYTHHTSHTHTHIHTSHTLHQKLTRHVMLLVPFFSCMFVCWWWVVGCWLLLILVA